MNLHRFLQKVQNGKGNRGMRRGAVTLEAALVLPVLLCAFLSVVFIIKAVYAYGVIHHALNETASEIASAGYIYHISGIRDLHDAARNGVNDRADLFKEQLGSVFDTYDSLKRIEDSPGNGLPGIPDSVELLKDADQNFTELVENAGDSAADPLEELKSIACYIAGGTFDDAKTQLFTPVLKLYMKKYLATDEIADADRRLRLLHVEGGFNGLDFSESSFLADRDETIDIVVRYQFRLPLPVQFLPGMSITQRAKVKAWMGGDEVSGVLGGSNSADDLWSLSNFQRGLKIRRLFGANLPSSYPVIARFSDGKAVMIKSVDMTAPSYQKGDAAEKLLKGYIKGLADFKGQDAPWGSAEITIGKGDIKSRELLLVIPQNKLSDTNEKLLASMISEAGSKGVTLVIKRYGTKSTGSGEEKDAGEGTDKSTGEGTNKSTDKSADKGTDKSADKGTDKSVAEGTNKGDEENEKEE